MAVWIPVPMKALILLKTNLVSQFVIFFTVKYQSNLTLENESDFILWSQWNTLSTRVILNNLCKKCDRLVFSRFFYSFYLDFTHILLYLLLTLIWLWSYMRVFSWMFSSLFYSSLVSLFCCLVLFCSSVLLFSCSSVLLFFYKVPLICCFFLFRWRP